MERDAAQGAGDDVQGLEVEARDLHDARPAPMPLTAPPPAAPAPACVPVTRGQLKASEQARRAAQARQASGRRRHVDPATCERDYSGAEVEFLRAIDAYKKSSGRLFPTWSEVLEVVRSLGYAQGPAQEAAR